MKPYSRALRIDGRCKCTNKGCGPFQAESSGPLVLEDGWEGLQPSGVPRTSVSCQGCPALNLLLINEAVSIPALRTADGPLHFRCFRQAMQSASSADPMWEFMARLALPELGEVRPRHHQAHHRAHAQNRTTQMRLPWSWPPVMHAGGTRRSMISTSSRGRKEVHASSIVSVSGKDRSPSSRFRWPLVWRLFSRWQSKIFARFGALPLVLPY